MLLMRIAILFASVSLFVIPAAAQTNGSVYSPAEILRDAKRLKTAMTKIFNLGIKPVLKPAERKALRGLKLRFPFPKDGDDVLNFYAAPGANPKIFLPVLSLKVLEDLTTAYAWLHQNRYSLSTIDIYFAMLRYRDVSDLPSGQLPPPLDALGIPSNALSDKEVDALALGLRNEAFAFLLAHELGHVHFAHKGYGEITKTQARADEVESDRFALDILARSNTPPLGAVLFFQAQAYRLPHRGDFKSRAAWNEFLSTRSTHPLTVDRIRHQSSFIASTLTQRRIEEKAIWSMIATKLFGIAQLLEDGDLPACIASLAARAPLTILKPRREIGRETMQKYCAG